MRIIPKEESKEKLELEAGDVIKATRPYGEKGYFMIALVRVEDEGYAYGLVSLYGDLAEEGLITIDGDTVASVSGFKHRVDELLCDLRDTGYTDIEKVTLEAREV